LADQGHKCFWLARTPDAYGSQEHLLLLADRDS
jgi:hypothetical protein